MIINPNNHETLVGIDEQVLAELMRRARPFLDEPNDVLRSLLALGRLGVAPRPSQSPSDGEDDGASPSTSHAAPPSRPRRRSRGASASPKPLRAAKGSLTREEAFEIPLLAALEQAGGEMPARQALEAVGEAMDDVLNEEDLYEDDKGVARWQKRVPFVRLKLIERGLMRSDAPRGVWAISEAGRRQLSRARG